MHNYVQLNINHIPLSKALYSVSPLFFAHFLVRATEHWHSCCWLRPPLHLSPVPSPTSLLFLLLLLLLDSGNVIRRHHRRRGGHSTAIPKYLLYGFVYASFNVVVVVGWGAHFLRGFELWDTVLGLQEGSSLARHVDSSHFWNPGISSECTLFSICCVRPWCMRPNLSPAEAIRTLCRPRSS